MKKLFENWNKYLTEGLMPDEDLEQLLSDLSHGRISVDDAKKLAGDDPDAHRWIKQWETELASREAAKAALQSSPSEDEEFEIEF